jgi:hypothetical protein
MTSGFGDTEAVIDRLGALAAGAAFLARAGAGDALLACLAALAWLPWPEVPWLARPAVLAGALADAGNGIPPSRATAAPAASAAVSLAAPALPRILGRRIRRTIAPDHSRRKPLKFASPSAGRRNSPKLANQEFEAGALTEAHSAGSMKSHALKSGH